MKIETLREFVEFSSHLNVSSLARELNISQSSMSRHLLDMEKELGVQLIKRQGRRTYLTKAGRVFLDNIMPLLNMYDFAVDASREASKEQETRIRIQEIAVRTAGSMSIYESMVSFKKQHKECIIEFSPLQGYNPEEALKKGLFDIAQVIVAGDEKSIIEHFEKKGIVAIPLISEPAFIWMSENNILAKKEHLTLDDLLMEVFCVAVGKIYDPMIGVINQMFLYSSLKPRIRTVGVESMAEFFVSAGDYENCIFLVTPQSVNDSRLLAHSDMVFKTVSDERARLTTCLLFEENNSNDTAYEFAEYVRCLVEDKNSELDTVYSKSAETQSKLPFESR